MFERGLASFPSKVIHASASAIEQGKEWETKYHALAAEATNARLAAAEEARLHTLKNLAATVHDVRALALC